MVFIDLSSDEDDDCLILSPCVFACKTKQYKEMAPDQGVSRNTRSKSKARMTKEDEVSLISTADAASHNKRRKAEKKKEGKLAVIPAATAAAAAAPKKTQVAEKKKKSPITVNKKIPQANVICVTPKGTVTYNMHTSLANKKIILYGLPGFYYTMAIPYTGAELVEKMTLYKPFYENSIRKPVFDFITQTEVLMGKGVDEILFFTVNSAVMMFALQTPEITAKYKHVKFISELRHYLHRLGIEIDIPLEGLGPRSRRFILLIDNLKVKFANIESRDENFNIPSNEEIIKGFDQ